MAASLGARWDDPGQNARFAEAARRGLVDYVEVNFPVPWQSDPFRLGLPVIAHTSSNPTCSAHGINPDVARLVREVAQMAASPWIGEHLTWLGSAPSGSLGYQINPLFTGEFRDIAARNVRRLKEYYGRPVALELGPIYTGPTGYESEMHFLADVAEAADTTIILDVTHWQIANRNLGRSAGYGLDALPRDRIVELHIAGMRRGGDGYWHDAHQMMPPDEIFDLVESFVSELPALQAVTFEHKAGAPAADFLGGLERLRAFIPANDN
ncbi:MAG: DUF692 family multinuclear iron-containing protein [Alphaproteobacteria bacterium]